MDVVAPENTTDLCVTLPAASSRSDELLTTASNKVQIGDEFAFFFVLFSLPVFPTSLFPFSVFFSRFLLLSCLGETVPRGGISGL